MSNLIDKTVAGTGSEVPTMTVEEARTIVTAKESGEVPIYGTGINEEALPGLSFVYDQLKDRLAQYRDADQEIEAARRKLKVLEVEIRNGDGSGLDDKKFETLDRKRRQFAALIATVEELEGRIEGRRAQMSRVLSILGERFGEACRPGYDGIVAAAMRAFSPFYSDESWARQAAMNCPAVAAYIGFIRTHFGQTTTEAVITEAEYALKITRSVLELRNPFAFGKLTFEYAGKREIETTENQNRAASKAPN